MCARYNQKTIIQFTEHLSGYASLFLIPSGPPSVKQKKTTKIGF